jgi:hypothetical protein
VRPEPSQPPQDESAVEGARRRNDPHVRTRVERWRTKEIHESNAF